jgi:hypothetical protein
MLAAHSCARNVRHAARFARRAGLPWRQQQVNGAAQISGSHYPGVADSLRYPLDGLPRNLTRIEKKYNN